MSSGFDYTPEELGVSCAFFYGQHHTYSQIRNSQGAALEVVDYSGM
jgi:hypothetical protein